MNNRYNADTWDEKATKRKHKTNGLIHAVLATLLAFSAMSSALADPPKVPKPQVKLAHKAGKNKIKPAPVVLVTIQETGGLTPSGGYRATTTIKSDGSYSRTAVYYGNRKAKLTSAELAQLKRQITEANFALLKAKPFTGTRPSSLDGTDIIYTFSTAQGKQSLTNYQIVINYTHPLFQTIDKLQQKYANGWTR